MSAFYLQFGHLWHLYLVDKLTVTVSQSHVSSKKVGVRREIGEGSQTGKTKCIKTAKSTIILNVT